MKAYREAIAPPSLEILRLDYQIVRVACQRSQVADDLCRAVLADNDTREESEGQSQGE